MADLEPHDELGLPWDNWADGQAHLLVRGRDYYRGHESVQDAAKNAARRLGKPVRTLKEDRLGRTYLWVQFADFETEWGEPCPGCGRPELQQINAQFSECASCRASVVLVKPKRNRGKGEAGGGRDAADALVQPLFGFGSLPQVIGGVAPEPTPEVEQEADAPAVLARIEPRPAEERAANGAEAAGLLLPGPDAAKAPPLTASSLQAMIIRANRDVSREEARAWRRSSSNAIAEIVASAVFARGGEAIGRLEPSQACEVCMLLELKAKAVDVRGGIVLIDPATNQGYRLLQPEPVRIARAGRYTMRVAVPPETFAGADYVGRASSVFVRDGELSRITLRGAFLLEVHGKPPVPPASDEDRVVQLLLPWTLEAGEGPWSGAAGPADG